MNDTKKEIYRKSMLPADGDVNIFLDDIIFVQYYSPATKGIRSWIWVLRKDIGKNNMMYSDHRKEKWND